MNVRVKTAVTVDPDQVPDVPGFAFSRFGPLVRALATRCLGEPGGNLGDRTALVLASAHADTSTLDLAGESLARGEQQDPMLFHQTVPTSILGVVCRDHGITGPVTCLSAAGESVAAAVELVAVMLTAREVDQALVLAVELAPTGRVSVIDPTAEGDRGMALLLHRDEGRPLPPGADLVTLCREWAK